MGSSQVRQQLKEKLQKEAAQYNPGKELRLVADALGVGG